MKPLLLHGSSDKARYDYAQHIAQKEDLLFIHIEPKDAYATLYKSAVTSSLNEKKRLYYIDDIESIFRGTRKSKDKKAEELSELTSNMAKSPHYFILSTSSMYDTPSIIKKTSNDKALGIDNAGPIDVIKYMQTERDRNKVREYLSLSKVELSQIMHMLKNGAWKSIEKDDRQVFHAIEACFQKLYMYKREYMLSMVAYLFPPKWLPFTSFAKEANPIVEKYEGVMEKVQSLYPHMSSNDFRDLYILMPTMTWGKEADVPKTIKIEAKGDPNVGMIWRHGVLMPTLTIKREKKGMDEWI